MNPPFLVCEGSYQRELPRGNKESLPSLRLKLASGPMGNEQERNRIEKLEDDLDVAIKKSLSGEFDGDEYGEGFCTIYTYGPSANRLYNSVQPTARLTTK